MADSKIKNSNGPDVPDENSSENYKYSYSDEKKLVNVFFIIVFSIFAGFVLGLLFAPQSGRALRKKLVNELRDIVDRGKFTLVEARVLGEELFEKGKEKVERASSKIKAKKESLEEE